MIETLDISEFKPQANFEIWDVRDADAFNEGHIKYAKNVPLDTINDDTVAKLDGVVYVLCGGGTKAGKATQKIHDINPSINVIHLTGGTRKALKLGFEIEAN